MRDEEVINRRNMVAIYVSVLPVIVAFGREVFDIRN